LRGAFATACWRTPPENGHFDSLVMKGLLVKLLDWTVANPPSLCQFILINALIVKSFHDHPGH